MAIVERITRLFTADVHAVLDRIEEPVALLHQAIREMEEALVLRTQQARALDAEQELLERRRAEVERALTTTLAQIDLCFDAGNEALLRSCVRRRLEGERMQRLLAQRAEQLARRIEESAALLTQQRERLESMRQKAALLELAPGACESAWSGDEVGVSEADVELALLREREARRSS
ncbi:MAG: PspA/IM30 family protein [Xanthomonadales bacterium]|nr:hypothetical protein [Xanthomonadales bacterium]MCC6592865.1 PspA/IM30 family protein [Xanthomonadales bacterium]MCE7931171.1 hypothetical protein [Xanthomonadales bacterium PRO6]